jgi:DnaK suppressor protein
MSCDPARTGSDRGFGLHNAGARCYPTRMAGERETGYVPEPGEAFMAPRQVAYFRDKLTRMRAETEQELQAAATQEAAGSDGVGDQADQASGAGDREFNIINRERARGLLTAIEAALVRLENGTYGYCEDTGEPIGLKRLMARPTATLSVEAQERRERMKRQYAD